MRRLSLPLAALLAAILAGAALAADPGGAKLVEAQGPGFPVRTFVLSLPNSRALTAGDLQVTENGGSVADLSVVPASKTGKKTFGVVLVVDASDSMAGTAIEKAVAAERAFAARRNPNQQLAVVAFATRPRVVLPLTTSEAKISAALTSPPKLAFGTHIFDAVAQAEAMLADAHIGSGSIVVLSDGADTGSHNTVAQVAAAARDAHVRLFTIGLKSKAFKPASLQSLAVAGGGDYTLARSTNDLAPLFDQLGQLLSSEYLVSYKSLAGPSLPVKVQVHVNGVGAVSTAYRTPALPVTKPPAPYSPSVSNRIWNSWITMVVLALVAAAVVALLVYGVFQPKQSGLPKRMAEFVSIPGLQSHRRRPGALSDDAAAEQANAPGPGLLTRLNEVLEIAQINTTAPRLVTGTAVGTVAAFVLVWLGTGSPWWALLALVIPLAVRWWVLWKLERRRKAFAEQLPDMLQVISAALRAGQSFAGAFAVVVESSGEPMKSEMQRVVADEQRGVPLSQAMAVVVKRMANRDLEQVALVAELQREAGGNAAEVVDRVADTVRGRFELRRLISTLTVQGRMSRWIVTALPVALVALITLINPHYMHPLVVRTLGKVMIALAVLLVIGGSLVIKKIVDIKV